MRRSSLKKLVSLFLALTLSLSLAACTPSQQEALTVYYGISSAWDALMPYNSVSGSNYARMIYDKLYDRLAYVHADGTLDPRGAESWESADGGYAVLFHLDQGAAFHDGTPVTAEHWADTIALLTDPLPGGDQRWGCIGTFVAVLGMLFLAAFLFLLLTGGTMLLAL